jgi:integrase
MSGKRITLRVVEALEPRALAWDSDVRGFGVRCQREAKVYVLKVRIAGKQRWFTIGRHGAPWTPETARREARRKLGEIAAGSDPAVARAAEKANPTLAELVSMFLEEHAEAKRKPRTAAEYRRMLTMLVLPRLGERRVMAITRADIASLHHGLRATPYQANRVLAVLSKLFSWAEKRGYREDGSNPCQHVEKYPERKRERFLAEEELAALGEALARAEREGVNPYVVAAIRLLLLTGARLNEILSLRWQDVDLERAMLRLPDSKTGQKPIYLSPPALEVLMAVPRIQGNDYVIVGHKPGASMVNLQKPWRAIRARAGLDDVRLHDLRHSFASVAAASGLSLPVIGALLGHTQAATTHRYAHLAADPVRQANDRIGGKIAASLAGKAALPR